MISHGVAPRVLADDILITAQGDGQVQKFCEAYEATIDYIKDIGGEMAPKKSVLFSTSRVYRKYLRERTWPQLGDIKIKALSAFRDLGTHLNLGDRQVAPTITARVMEATAAADRLRNLPMSDTKKQRILRGLVLAKALDGNGSF